MGNSTGAFHQPGVSDASMEPEGKVAESAKSKEEEEDWEARPPKEKEGVTDDAALAV
jgi:hypothetical protein